MKLLNLVQAGQGIQKLANLDLNDPIKSYKISKLLKQVQEQVNLYDEQRKKLLKKFGEPKDGNNNAFYIPNENMADFQRQINDLNNIDVDIDYSTIDVDVKLMVGVTANEMLLLEPFVNIIEVEVSKK